MPQTKLKMISNTPLVGKAAGKAPAKPPPKGPFKSAAASMYPKLTSAEPGKRPVRKALKSKGRRRLYNENHKDN